MCEWPLDWLCTPVESHCRAVCYQDGCSDLREGGLCAQFKVDAKAVKSLRDKTGAGMMDAKKALISTAGDIDKAVEYLRKKGLASADKKAGRVAAEGIVASYIHAGSRCV